MLWKLRAPQVLMCAVLMHGSGHAQPSNTTMRTWVEQMKQAERGPFERLRWFCNDGSVLPPAAYACADHGGGHQHGEWSERARTLRENGFFVANLLAGVDGREWLADPQADHKFAQLIIERFLIGADDGWILRRALFYRGAIQEEDEREGARKLLVAAAGNPYWIGPGYAALRVGARLLPHGQDSASIDRIRQVSASLADRDPGFQALRAKIHGAPDAGDAERVRDYASSRAVANLAQDYRALADEIDAVYTARPLGERLRAFIDSKPPASLSRTVQFAASRLSANASPLLRLEVAGQLLADLHDAILATNDPAWRLAGLDLSFVVENDFFTAATDLRRVAQSSSRADHVAALEASASAAYGAGLINRRLHSEMQSTLASLKLSRVPLGDYRRGLSYLSRAPGWATQALRMHFFESMQKLAELEPIAMRFVQDQLRGSPLLLYADMLDSLSRDAGRLAGVRHEVLGEDAGAVFTALNPGLARGVLRVAPDLDDVESFRPDGIYVVPETVSDLPPVAGILTAGEGNPLSHVQLLARNLGIPNATVSESLLPRLRELDGTRVVLAVSPAGLVTIARDGPEWNARLGDSGEASSGALIRPDLDKLDLSVTTFVDLDDLVAADSGRTVGPKAAKLGELRDHYPDAVAPGLAIPFGIFKKIALDQQHPAGGSVYDWMVAKYRELGPVDPLNEAQAARYEAFRAELYELIADIKFDAEFRAELTSALRGVFGRETPGVFVRSDTNVEDLAGFTGAGLNLTLPNVVGTDALLAAIPRVWASPFTARAFAWRQSHMTSPEHVYTSILLLRSVASDKSGVLVTQDIDTGDRGVISVAVNEGLGGAVDGQAAESLRIDMGSGAVRVLATATAPTRRVPDPNGGLRFLKASGSDTVLQPDEVRQLIEFGESLPRRFPPIVDDEGNSAAADVEFGFFGGRLQLFQLRPFLENRDARASQFLVQMDSTIDASRERSVTIDMSQPPG